jgi:hypothetical protein
MFERREGRRQIDAAEYFCRSKSYARPAIRCVLLKTYSHLPHSDQRLILARILAERRKAGLEEAKNLAGEKSSDRFRSV